jgi:hypothetical protein
LSAATSTLVEPIFLLGNCKAAVSAVVSALVRSVLSTETFGAVGLSASARDGLGAGCAFEIELLIMSAVIVRLVFLDLEKASDTEEFSSERRNLAGSGSAEKSKGETIVVSQ